jgi:hypothetical protein
MSSEAQLEQAATDAAEEILRRIYGDDFEGCTVSLDSIAAVVNEALKRTLESDRSLLELFEKAFEAVQLLSTPPSDGGTLGPNELRSLLSDRLDSIQTLASKVISTSSAVRQQNSKTEPDL